MIQACKLIYCRLKSKYVIKILRTQNTFLILFVLFFVPSAFAQLPAFNLTVAKTDESCTGNGTLSFNVSGTTAGTTISYSIYKFPELVTPIATTTANTLGGLSAGNLRIIATQSSANGSNAQQKDVLINSTVVPLLYLVTGSISCNNSVLTVQVMQGNAVGYEIIAGPVLRARQASNVFNGLPAGTYRIRVYDNCNDAVVRTYTLQNTASVFTIDFIDNSQNCALASCNQISIANKLTAITGVITYPVTATYTIHPPSGVAIVQSQVISSGDQGSLTISATIPYYQQAYNYDLKVTDNCGNLTQEEIVVNKLLELNLKKDPEKCANNFTVALCNYLPPYTVSFVAAPAGFNPALFNPNASGIFSEAEIAYESTNLNTMPAGNYVVKITDACGQSTQSNIQLQQTTEPNYSVLSQGCAFGQITIPANSGTFLSTSIITSAPAAYGQILPHNVSGMIDDGILTINLLPVGTYHVRVLDICGRTFEYDIVIPPSTGVQPIITNFVKGCEEGYASILLRYPSQKISSITITSAPALYTGAVPANLSANIGSDGNFLHERTSGRQLYLFDHQFLRRNKSGFNNGFRISHFTK